MNHACRICWGISILPESDCLFFVPVRIQAESCWHVSFFYSQPTSTFSILLSSSRTLWKLEQTTQCRCVFCRDNNTKANSLYCVCKRSDFFVWCHSKTMYKIHLELPKRVNMYWISPKPVWDQSQTCQILCASTAVGGSDGLIFPYRSGQWLA